MSIAWSSAAHLERLWDEQVDHDIALGLRDHPLTDETPALDASQMRLPMYVNALAYAITGADGVRVSRAVSLMVGAVTVYLTFELGCLLFGSLAGLLAAMMLGLSPYFLSFARIAMTEGDVFFACCTTLAVLTFLQSLRKPTAGRWLIAGICLGLALGAKFFAVFLFIVFAVLARATPSLVYAMVRTDQRARRRFTFLLTVALILAGATIVSTYLLRASSYGHENAEQVAVTGWALALLTWFALLFQLRRPGSLPIGPLARCLLMIPFAILTCCVLMPAHMTEPDIAAELCRRALRWDYRVPLVLWSDHLRLYSGIILVKQGVALGVVNAAALIYAAIRERVDGRWRPCVLAIIFYLVLLCTLPLRQTFYLMAVYPLIMIVSAGYLTELGEKLRLPGNSRKARIFHASWACAIMMFLVLGGARLVESYPQLNLAGYALVQDRWLGAESRGYRNLIQTPSDGVEELIQWCNTSPLVRSGNTVVSYLWEERIIQTLLPPDRKYLFISRGLSQERDALPPQPPIAQADFVLLHINNLLGYGDRPPDHPPLDKLSRNFEVVHAVIRWPLTVGWVYARKAATVEHARPREGH